MYKKAWLLCLLASTILAVPDKIDSFVLQNGLKVVVLQDHRSPIVNVQVWYKVGSRSEENGTTGISHALEHMMFRGTSKVSSYKDVIADLGGQSNAFTSRDFTVYHQTVPKEGLDRVLELEADRMVNLKINHDLFVKEMAAVLEERRMRVDDAPLGLAMEQFTALAFLSNPYHHPIIGWEGDIKQYTVEDAQIWYKKWYMPNNAIVVVSGDVDLGEAKNLVSKRFSLLENRQLAKEKYKSSQPIIANKKMYVTQPVEGDRLVFGYMSPVFNNLDKQDQWHMYALDVLSALLVKNIEDDLQQKQRMITDSSVSYNGLSVHDDLFMITLTLAENKKLTAVEQAITNLITRLKLKPVSKSKLDMVKAQVAANYVYSKDSLNAKAFTLGMLSALDLPLDFIDKYVENINNVTAKQVQEVAQLYFKKNVSMYVKAKGSRLL